MCSATNHTLGQVTQVDWSMQNIIAYLDAVAKCSRLQNRICVVTGFFPTSGEYQRHPYEFQQVTILFLKNYELRQILRIPSSGSFVNPACFGSFSVQECLSSIAAAYPTKLAHVWSVISKARKAEFS